MSWMCTVGQCEYKGNFWKVIYHMITKHFGLTRSLIRRSDIMSTNTYRNETNNIEKYNLRIRIRMKQNLTVRVL